MSNSAPIVITGCQRSGTTLLHLILDSHPQVTALDETDVDPLSFPSVLHEIHHHSRLAVKLPTAAHEVATFAARPELSVLWCLRDPRDVVASMVKLQQPAGESTISWASHPHGVFTEIRHCASVLGTAFDPACFARMQTFTALCRKRPQLHNREDAVFCAALCWRLKQELLPLYEQFQIRHHVVRYEDLVREPEETIEKVLSFVDLPFHLDVMRHHQLHSGTAIGETDRSRPIDPTSVGRWKSFLNASDLQIIDALCGDVAEDYEYSQTETTLVAGSH